MLYSTRKPEEKKLAQIRHTPSLTKTDETIKAGVKTEVGAEEGKEAEAGAGENLRITANPVTADTE